MEQERLEYTTVPPRLMACMGNTIVGSQLLSTCKCFELLIQYDFIRVCGGSMAFFDAVVKLTSKPDASCEKDRISSSELRLPAAVCRDHPEAP